ncbi:MAG: hypothetical protein CMJ47_10440 [Planctomyces sp.]|nr:hypothetical protein [Planctomyces sp.]
MNAKQAPTAQAPLGEPDAHLASRHMQTGVRIVLILCLMATVGLLLFNPAAAYLAAISVPVLIVVLVFVGFLERRSRAERLRTAGQSQISQHEVDVDVETIGVITVLKVVGALAVGSFIAAATIFDLATLGIAASVAFLIFLLTQLYILPIFFLESERDEREKLTGSRD